METFLQNWHHAAMTSAGFFWMAFWAFGLGYMISSLIQVLVTKERMQRTMGESGPKSVALGTFFGFISSSCSFAALATTRALFRKGAGLVPSLAFLLGSTNLVIELGIVIAVFLSWQFVVGEYVGGILLILFAWLFVKLTNPQKLIKQAREKLGKDDGGGGKVGDWRRKLRSLEGWQQIGRTYVMEWQMVWRDVLIGFTVAGIIAAFVPHAFFEWLFVGSAEGVDAGFSSLLLQTLVGPLAAFFTFIGSMGNIPLAALLFDNGVSFAGVMAFIFSDLVVLPVLRINATYYGWKMALYILAILLASLVVVSLVMHYGLLAFDALPSPGGVRITERDHFQVDYTLFLNLAFIAVTAAMVWLWRRDQAGHDHHHHHHSHGGGGVILKTVSRVAAVWLVAGLVLGLIM